MRQFDSSVIPYGQQEQAYADQSQSGGISAGGGESGAVGGGESGAAGIAGVAAASGGNPYLMAAMIGLKALSASKKRKAMERKQRFQAQIATTNRMQNALSQLSGIGRSLKL